MEMDFVFLAFLMGLVTYPGRALPLLFADVKRMPRVVHRYLELVAPSVLAGLAAVSVALQTGDAGGASLRIGPEWLSVAVCLVLVYWRRNLLAGLLLAASLIAVLRAVGIAATP
jgi:branched-subunit amino acid transport protein